MYHYSAGMAKMIENELTNKGEDQLDFEKDPQHIVGELICALQGFDSVANRQCLNVIKPKLEVWLQTKLVTIREVVSRAIQFETWTPISDVNTLLNLSNYYRIK
jgi:hypothetical protein